MPVSNHPTSVIDTRQRLSLATARRMFAVGALVCIVGAAALVVQDMHHPLNLQVGLITACLAMALLFALARWKAHVLPPTWAVLGTAWAGCGLVTLVAVAGGRGVQSLDLGFFGLLICMVAVLAGARHAVMMTLCCAAVIAGITAAELDGRLNGAARVAETPLSDPVISLMLLLAAGLSVGLIVAGVADESYRALAEREHRFRALLKMAADRYWELDSELRFVRADATTSSILGTPPEARLGLRPWETADKMGIAPQFQQPHFLVLFSSIIHLITIF